MFPTFDPLLWQRYRSVFLKDHMNYRYIKKTLIICQLHYNCDIIALSF